ncbi:hormonally up-regulated neu tumor-associated kinase isoform X2 [Falco biarmicus]|uniref:hormonally up-regulated neu tumor-associated kinase isoform X2 n=1 Tax=Falco rusticolus TaxID=120794 RepID=UPI0018866775|nr:hormonally up-regulated neu tumor-associated kinase isoform X2 [Falco rusticolus]XP_040438744.1 hormonally up-regulated neu tumor-associated kinase isoform X2 [Falco naumanni]XP_055558484.1 hormonally up-regulated neu tumor-associated kinase isoform X2 [Falco cherrug]XP_055658473.1 hormonally up-regulated neu tumor-associated kinase isoform X2 [Falco peregrinus]XP_056184784.1 hormonally up-regulated neu tumor-associated kinase isoform X2 [Falco biarmicus]
MPAAAGDGLLSEPPAVAGGGGEARKAAAGAEGSFLAAWLSAAAAAPRERLRDFQHTKRVGNYLIGRKLGEGSFAKVREGLHVLTGEKVAVKVIDKKRAKKDTYVTKNLRREGQIQQMIRHPNIAQLLDILETENSYYLVMELCPGGNLMHKIYEKKRLEEHEARKYIRQLILAVEHLHRAGVVHRDLKIENLLLDEDNNIKLIDFGLSNCAGILGYSDPFSTQCGSPAYAAPELLARKKYGPKIDVWSIGVNMYAMLTGTLPFTVEPFSLRALYQKMVDKEMNPFPTQLSAAAVNFLRSLLEPDPAKRPNIQQALANRWLNENYPGRAPPNVTYPNRIHLEDLSQSVLLHMTEKLGYKNSDVINTVLSNRASHTLAIYFLLNKKLERYLASLRKSEGQDNICHKNQLYQIEKYKMNKESYEIQNTKALLKDRKVTKAGGPEKDSSGGVSPFHEPLANKTGCVTSSSLEYLEVQQPPPRTPRLLKRQESPQQEPARIGGRAKDSPLILNIVHSFESVDREDQIDQVSPSHQYRILGSPMNFPYKSSSERTLSPLFQPGSTSPIHPTQVSFTYEEKAYPAKEEAVSPTQLVSNNPLGSPNCVKSRGRFPMMGIGQMLRKRNQTMQSASDKPLEARMPQLQQMSPTQISFNAADAVSGQC